MRFSFRRKEEPRWIDTPDLAWVPDNPFDLAPGKDAPEGLKPETNAAPIGELGDLSPGALSPFTIAETINEPGAGLAPPSEPQAPPDVRPAPHNAAACCPIRANTVQQNAPSR